MTTSDWQPDLYARHAAFVPALARDLVGWLAPRPGEDVLDLGCGDGVLTQDLLTAGARVIGIDASPAMAAAARARGIDARVGAAETLTFDGAFDAAFSNAMLHWTRDVHATLAGVARALRPGGRFVGEFGGAGNIVSILAAARSELDARRIHLSAAPWYFPSREEFSGELARAGFVVDDIHAFARPTALPGGIVEWLQTFGAPLLEHVSAEERLDAARAIEARLRPTNRAADGLWTVDYVRLRFKAHRPAPTPPLARQG